MVGRITRVIGDVLETMRLERSRYRRCKIRTPDLIDSSIPLIIKLLKSSSKTV